MNRSGPSSAAELGPEDLDRHLAVVLEVVGELDGGHAAAAELALEGVAARERGGEPGEMGGDVDGTGGKLQRDRAEWRAALPYGLISRSTPSAVDQLECALPALR